MEDNVVVVDGVAVGGVEGIRKNARDGLQAPKAQG